MSTEKKNPRKRDHALHEATHGQFGEEPRPEPYPDKDPRRDMASNPRREMARKKSKTI